MPLWAILAVAGMSTLWCCPSSTSSANCGVAHPQRCLEGWCWRGCCGVWHARTMQFLSLDSRQNSQKRFQLTHHHHHQSFNCKGRWGTTDDFATRFRHLSLSSTALLDLPNSRSVHSLMLSSHLFLCLPCLLPPFTVPCKMVLARPDGWETWPYNCSLCLFTMVRMSSCGPIACWILAQTSSLVTWSLYEMCSICGCRN